MTQSNYANPYAVRYNRPKTDYMNPVYQLPPKVIEPMKKSRFQVGNLLGRIIPQPPLKPIFESDNAQYTDYTRPQPFAYNPLFSPNLIIQAENPIQAQSRAKSFWYDYMTGTTPQEKAAREFHSQF